LDVCEKNLLEMFLLVLNDISWYIKHRTIYEEDQRPIFMKAFKMNKHVNVRNEIQPLTQKYLSAICRFITPRIKKNTSSKTTNPPSPGVS